MQPCRWAIDPLYSDGQCPEGTCPAKEKPLDWLLLTSVSVQNFQQAQSVILGYTQRWRIEEFHKTWKTGACNVEQAQLRTQQAVKIWATVLAAVAARIERLKVLSRSTPEQPANVELTSHEIRALILLKRQNKKRNEIIPDTTPTIGQAHFVDRRNGRLYGQIVWGTARLHYNPKGSRQTTASS